MIQLFHLDIYTREISTFVHQKTNTRMVIALFTMSKN